MIYQLVFYNEPRYNFNFDYMYGSNTQITQDEDINIDTTAMAIVLGTIFLDTKTDGVSNVLRQTFKLDSFSSERLYYTLNYSVTKMPQYLKDFIYEHALFKNIYEFNYFLKMEKIVSKKI